MHTYLHVRNTNSFDSSRFIASYMRALPNKLHVALSAALPEKSLPLFRLFPNPGLGHLESSYPLELNWRIVANGFDRLERNRYGVQIPIQCCSLPPARIRRSLLDFFLSSSANHCPATLNQRGLCLVLSQRLHIKTLQGIDSDETLKPAKTEKYCYLRASYVLGIRVRSFVIRGSIAFQVSPIQN